MTLSAISRHVPWRELLEGIEHGGTGVAICNDQGLFIYINRPHVEMYGYESEEEFLGRPWTILYDEEEQRKYEEDYFPTLMAQGRWSGYSVARKKDGSPFHEQVWLSRLDSGGIVCFCRDVTEDERVARERDGFFEQNGSLAVVTTVEGLILDCNSTFLEFTGLHREDLDKRTLPDLFSGAGTPLLSEALPNLHAGGTVAWRGVLGVGPKSGNRISWLASKLKGSDRIFLIGSDISSTLEIERKMEASLAKERELVEMKTRFFSLANHELRNPLSVIALASEALADRKGCLTPERRSELATTLLGRVEECRSLLDKFMQLDRHFSGRMAFHPCLCRPDLLLREIVRGVLLGGSHPRSAEVEVCSTPTTEIERLLDADLFRAIVTNLLSNALNYSPAGTPVTVRLAGDGAEVTLSVIDRGPGIPALEAPRLFDPFFRGSGATTSPGSGLGLPLARLCAAAHGGDLVFQSGKGQGSTFTARLQAPAPPPCPEDSATAS